MIKALRNSIVYTGNVLGREVRGMHAAAYVLGASALISSLLALVRDRLFAHFFGAGPELDIYFSAFRLPDLLFIVLGALVTVYVLIPALSERTKEQQIAFIESTVIGFSVLAAAIGTLLYFFCEVLMEHIFPIMMSSERRDVLVLSTQLLLLQPVLLGFSNILAAITQYSHRYFLYAATPIVYNVGIIVGIVFLYPYYGLYGLMAGVILGAALHVGIQLPSVWRGGFLRRIPRTFSLNSFLRVTSISAPRALALSMQQLGFLGLLSFAGGLSSGSIAIFMFAFNLQAVPLAIVGASYSVAAFPALANAWAMGNRDEFMSYIHVAARQILFWSIPLLMLIVVLRAHAVRAVLGSGAFDWTDTRLTAAAFALFALSLAAQGLALLLYRACYAAGKTYVPLIISLLGTGTALVLGRVYLDIFSEDRTGVFLQILLRVADVPGSDVLALILAYTTASIITTLLLMGYVEARLGSIFAPIASVLSQGITAGFMGSAVAYATLTALGDITLASTLGSVLFRGGCAGLMGIAAIAIVYHALGSAEYRATVLMLRRRLSWTDESITSPEG